MLSLPSSFTALSDADLLTEVSRLATCERDATAQFVASLAEFDARRLYLGRGFSSMFIYCTQALHLSEHAAYNRIEAARTVRRFPMVLDRLADGSLTLTTVCLLAAHLTPENHGEVLDAARHKSKREVEVLVARLRPLPPVPSSVRKLPAVPNLRRPVASPLSPLVPDSNAKSAYSARRLSRFSRKAQPWRPGARRAFRLFATWVAQDATWVARNATGSQKESAMIDGLKLTFTGEELRALLEERIADHNGSADHWRHQQSRAPESETEDEPLLPDHICEYETERHERRAEVLEFIRDHVDARETYRLTADLEFGELLPPEPGAIEPEDDEERTAVGFSSGA